MATLGMMVGLIFIFYFYACNVTDGEWPSGW
jgi:hypothetical protein